MEEKMFKVGYSSYLKNNKNERWTSYILRKISKHKFISTIIGIIFICIVLNIYLVYSFVKLLEVL